MLGVIAMAVVSLAGFLRYETRRADPFIDLRFFRSAPFASATVTAVCAFAGWASFLFDVAVSAGRAGYSAHAPG